MNIYVGNLHYDATETDLEERFAEYGLVDTVSIKRDRDTGKSRGFGFVEMRNQEDGSRAIEALNGKEMMGRRLEVNPARPRGQRRESQQPAHSNRSSSQQSEVSSGETFHNPYTFVPSPPRQDAIKQGGFAGDFDPLKCGLDHAFLKDNLWTGHIPIKLTTVTPLVFLKGDGEDRTTDKHQTYDVLDHIPESSLRGMLRSAYEVVTNSRYGCFRNEDRLAYRMIPRESLELIPAVIENDKKSGKLVARLYPGTSRPTPRGPEGPMYAAMLTLYHRNPSSNSVRVGGYDPQTGDEVWAEINRRSHGRYQYWKVVKVWPKSKYPTKPSATGKIVEGRVLITNANMGNKHDERIFFNPHPNTFDVTDHVKQAWRMRIKSYREAHSENDIFGRTRAKNEPWKKIGRDPGETAWSPHLYQDGKHPDRWGRKVHDAIELQADDMVYARCEFDRKGNITGIADFFPVMISRELYADSPAALLDSLLQPAGNMSKLSPADRLFGWVPPQKQDQNKASEGGYKGRIRVVCEDGARPDIVERFGNNTLPLTILGQPKPAQGRFYVAKDAQGTPQHGTSKQAAGYEVSSGKRLRGRKQYWHHKGLEANQAPEYWNPSVADRTQQQSNGRYQEYRRPDQNGQQQTDSQNRSIKGWIKPSIVFEATLYVQNLQPEEVGALLWLLSLPEDHYFRLGYGKPLGFGSVKMEIDKEQCANGCLPLGTGEDWKEYYAAFDASPPTTLDEAQKNDCIQAFKASMVADYNPLQTQDEAAKEDEEQKTSGTPQQLTSFADLKTIPIKIDSENRKDLEDQHFNELPFIADFLQVLRGPVDNAPIHYPRLDREPNPEGKNFEWFTANERNRNSQHALSAVTDAKGLPYKP
jgi:CRISPR-associated protein (TIGR03986 family)